MIEALIDLRFNGERNQREHGAEKRRGDVICVKLAGSPWDAMEQKFFLVVEWQDDDLQRRLLAMRKDGDKFPVIEAPYAEHDKDGNRTVRSRRFFDVEELGTSIKEAVLNRNSRVEKIEYFSRAVKTR